MIPDLIPSLKRLQNDLTAVQKLTRSSQLALERSVEVARKVFDSWLQVYTSASSLTRNMSAIGSTAYVVGELRSLLDATQAKLRATGDNKRLILGSLLVIKTSTATLASPPDEPVSLRIPIALHLSKPARTVVGECTLLLGHVFDGRRIEMRALGTPVVSGDVSSSVLFKEFRIDEAISKQVHTLSRAVPAIDFGRKLDQIKAVVSGMGVSFDAIATNATGALGLCVGTSGCQRAVLRKYPYFDERPPREGSVRAVLSLELVKALVDRQKPEDLSISQLSFNDQGKRIDVLLTKTIDKTKEIATIEVGVTIKVGVSTEVQIFQAGTDIQLRATIADVSVDVSTSPADISDIPGAGDFLEDCLKEAASVCIKGKSFSSVLASGVNFELVAIDYRQNLLSLAVADK